MQKTPIHPAGRLLILAAFTFAGVMFMFFVGLVIIRLLYGYNLLTDMVQIQEMDTPLKVNALKMLQLTSTIGFFIIPPLLLYRIDRRVSFTGYFSLGMPVKSWMLLLVPVLAWFMVPVINVVGELNKQMDLPEAWGGIEEWMRGLESNAETTTRAFTSVDTLPGLLFNMVLIGIMPAIGEELYFRGTVQPLFARWFRNHHLAIWISAIIFSALHFQFYGFLPRMLLGVAFGYLLLWSGSLWVPILTHFVNNATVVVVFYLMNTGVVSTDIEEMGTAPEEMVYYLVTGLLLSGMLFWHYYRHRQRVDAQSFHPPDNPVDDM